MTIPKPPLWFVWLAPLIVASAASRSIWWFGIWMLLLGLQLGGAITLWGQRQRSKSAKARQG